MWKVTPQRFWGQGTWNMGTLTWECETAQWGFSRCWRQAYPLHIGIGVRKHQKPEIAIAELWCCASWHQLRLCSFFLSTFSFPQELECCRPNHHQEDGFLLSIYNAICHRCICTRSKFLWSHQTHWYCLTWPQNHPSGKNCLATQSPFWLACRIHDISTPSMAPQGIPHLFSLNCMLGTYMVRDEVSVHIMVMLKY